MWLWNLPKPSFDLKFETLLNNLRGRPVCIHSPWWRVWSPPAWRLRGRTRRWRRRPSRRAAPPPCREGRWWSSPHSPELATLARSRSRPRIISTNLPMAWTEHCQYFPGPEPQLQPSHAHCCWRSSLWGRRKYQRTFKHWRVRIFSWTLISSKECYVNFFVELQKYWVAVEVKHLTWYLPILVIVQPLSQDRGHMLELGILT